MRMWFEGMIGRVALSTLVDLTGNLLVDVLSDVLIACMNL